jgi:cytochrome c-type biogenesis protein CcmF
VTFAVFWGTIFPTISELVTGTKITVGPPFFKQVTGPLFSSLVLLMAIAPFFAWRRQSWKRLGKILFSPILISLGPTAIWGSVHKQHPASLLSLWLVSFVLIAIFSEFWKGSRARMSNLGENPFKALGKLIGRNRRRYGGYLVHLGVILIGLGFIGDSFFKIETQGTLGRGESLHIGAYELRFDNLEMYPGSDGREVLEASTALFKDGKYLTELIPRRDYFVVQRQPVTVPGVYSTMGEDVYVLLVGWEEIGLESSTFKIYVNPLINWTWIGGIVLVLGALITLWPSGPTQARRSYVIEPRPLKPRYGTGD